MFKSRPVTKISHRRFHRTKQPCPRPLALGVVYWSEQGNPVVYFDSKSGRKFGVLVAYNHRMTPISSFKISWEEHENDQ